MLRSAALHLIASTPFNRGLAWLLVSARRRRTSPAPLAEARTILVIKPDEIGDVVLATGFLREIRRACPRARVIVAVRSTPAPLIPVPELADEIFVWRENWRTWPFGYRAWRSLTWEARARFHPESPDWAFIPRGNGDHMLMSVFAWWTGARRICAHENFCHEWGPNRRALISNVVPESGPAHEVELHERMLRHVGVPSPDARPQIAIPEAVTAAARARLAGWEQGGTIVALGIGAGTASRVWPEDNFLTLVRHLLRKNAELRCIVIGGQPDFAAGQRIAASDPDRVVNLAGACPLLETAALLHSCALYIGNDSGPMHLAAAAGCAVVEISKHPRGGSDRSPNSPRRFGPLAVRSRILQPRARTPECAQACEHLEPHCITSIRVEEVLDASQALLAELRARAAK